MTEIANSICQYVASLNICEQIWRYWPIYGLSFHLLPYFMYTNSEGSGQTLQMHWLVWAFAARQCKNKIPDFLQSKLKNIKLFSMKCYLLCIVWRRTRVRSICSPLNIISSTRKVPFASNETCIDIGSHCLQTFFRLFYQVYKIETFLNPTRPAPHDATPGLGLQCLPSQTNWQPLEMQRKWPHENDLDPDQPRFLVSDLGQTDKSMRMSMDVYSIYTCQE